MEPKKSKKAGVALKATSSKASMIPLVDSMMLIEKLITGGKIRKTHLKKNGLYDPQTDFFIKEATEFKGKLLGPIAGYVEEHPAYCWFSRVRGIGKENIAKVLCFIRVKPETKLVNWCDQCNVEVRNDDATCVGCGSENLSTKEIELPFARTVSALWKYAGYATDDHGKADRRAKGEKLPFNMTLKVMCTRLSTALLKASAVGSKGPSAYGQFYTKEYAKYVERFTREGKKVAKVSEIPKNVKPGEYVHSLHVHQMAVRKMIKLFLSHLWEVWRTAEGLPVRPPYSFEYQGHTTLIDPWEMVDRPLKKIAKKQLELD